MNKPCRGLKCGQYIDENLNFCSYHEKIKHLQDSYWKELVEGNQQMEKPPTKKKYDKHNSSSQRKDSPVFGGVLQYFPLAIMEISRHSKRGNDKHNPGQPLHWAKEKSKDHADCVARHLIDIGPNWNDKDPETGSYHATALAWRALALLQTLLEQEAKKNDNK